MTQLHSSTSTTSTYVIPHHGVFKNSEQNPKLRVVFNASARSSNGFSLNDKLLTGKKLQNDVSEILTRFRLHPFVISSDICKMYRQILIHPEDRIFQTILWRENQNSPLATYASNTVTYGVSSSPFLAIRTLHQLVADEGADFPLASKAILNDMFVDDCLTGSDSLDEAFKLKSELIELLKRGGFELSKWASNSRELLEDIVSKSQDILFSEDKDHNQFIKVLGLKWNQNTDEFTYEVPIQKTLPTKRGILSMISRIFDPLGLVTPVVLWAKCMMQQIWFLGLDWDEILPDDLFTQSKNFFHDLPLLSKLRIPRNVLPQNSTGAQLHGFSDASEFGYGCSVYLRVVTSDGSVMTNLLMAKSKVAPLKKISIPKLELCGALLLSKAMSFCKIIISCKYENIPLYAWTDSMVVLHWIHTSPHLLKTFVANRIAELQHLIEPSCWSHTPTTSNPADVASRGLLPHQLLDCSLWWYGPTWLSEDQQSWPPITLVQKTNIPEEGLNEFRPASKIVTASVGIPQPTPLYSTLEDFSNLTKLQNCFGWILRFIRNCRKVEPLTKTKYLTATERNTSLGTLVKLTQQKFFQEHFDCILKQKTCTPAVQRLDPFIDSSGILRVGGRLEKAQLPYNAKHPMLLPKNSHLTYLLIDHYHLNYLHVGPRTLQSLLCRQFWIISARTVIRHRLAKCVTCARCKGKTPQPFMGNLPEERIVSTRPFLKVGVDFGGPYSTKSDKLRKPQLLKSYICLFVCMATKAVHLEMVSSLSTEAFLAAFKRFIFRRGLCSDIFSDQGTNFVGANRELTELYQFFSQQFDSILPKLSNQGITWHFIPPSSPHFGGLWESGIKSTKHHIKRVLGSQILNFEEFSTLLTQIEAILNSRPLCSLSSDPNEFEPLTPGHFLIGQPLVALPQADFTSTPMNRLSRWQLIQQTLQHFWNRWNLEYLHQLQQRQKWFVQNPNLKIGELVLIKDSNLPPASWLTARIIETHPGEDEGLEHIEHAYVQQLATGSGFYIWPDLVLRVNLARWRARPTILQDILYLLGAAGPKIRWNFRAPEWDIIEKATCIQQPTGSVDCGVYVCLYTEQIATGTSVTDLGALDGVALRKRMASALRRSELIGDEEQLLIKD
ncbi:uncharacterized protein LOC128984526 [Macrosteles quadrilineatus]|uniref:uncharacterized protein LOC128984526 n=1 Tax=Macrosteles quadrilineatus TaxID=74068 RepID=UPI0023E0FFA4|nr:uncharacterized protein LOC128984526 [Macrosteles quadrilineatus]